MEFFCGKLIVIIARRRSEELSTTGVTQGNLGLPLPPNSLHLHETQKQQDEILDSTRVLISLSNNRDENKLKLRRAIAYKSCAKSNEQRTKSNKQRGKSNEQRAKSKEQRVTSKTFSLEN